MRKLVTNLSKDELIKEFYKQQEQIKSLNQEIEILSEERSNYKELFDNSPTPMWEEDITDLILHFKMLKANGINNFREYFDANPNELSECIKKIQIINVNDATISLHRAKSKKQFLDNLESLFTEKSKEVFKNEIMAMANGDLTFESETDALTFDDTPVDLKLYLKVTRKIRNNKTKYTALVSTVDITKQKKAESRLVRSEIDLRNILDASEDVALLVDRNGYIVESNKACQDLYRVKRIDLVGRKLNYFATKDILEERKRNFLEAINSKKTVTYENKAYDKIWISKISPLLDESNNVNNIAIFHRDITSIKIAEKKIRDSELKFKTIFDHIKNSITHIDRNGFITDINDFHLQHIAKGKRKLDDFLGTNILERKSIKKAGIDSYYRDLLKGKPFELSEIYFPETANGESFYFNIQGVPLYSNEILTGAIITTEDVTKEVLNRVKLEKVQERLKLALEGAKIGFWDHDYTTNKIWRSELWFEMLGFKKSDFDDTIDVWKKLIHPEDIETIIQANDKIQNSEQNEFKVEHRMMNSKGEYQWILNWGKVTENSKDGKPKRAAGIHIDITELKIKERVLKENEQKYSTLVEQANEGIIINQDWKIKYCNDYFSKMLGYSKDEILNSSLDKYLTKEEIKKTKQRYESRVIGEEVINIYESKAVTKEGKVVPIEINAKYMLYNGMPAVQSIIRDISERKAAELEKDKQQKELDLIYNSSTDNMALIKVIDDDFRIASFNQSYWNSVSILNSELTKESLINASIYDLNKLFNFPDSVIDLFIKNYTTVLKKLETIEIIESLPIGENKIFLETKFSPILDENGKCTHILYASKDITERIIIEEELKNSEAKFRSLFESMYEGVFYQSADGTLNNINKSALNIFETTLEKFVGNTFKDQNLIFFNSSGELISYEDLPFMKVLETGKELLEFELGFKKNENDEITWLLTNGIPQFRYKEGKPFQVFVTIRDITEQKNAAQNLLASQKRYKTLFDSQPTIIWEEDFSLLKDRFNELKNMGITDFRKYLDEKPDEVQKMAELVSVVEVNSASLKILEANSKEELITNLSYYFDSEEAWKVIKEELIDLANGSLHFESEIPVRTIKGNRKYLYLKLQVLPDNKDDLKRVIVNFLDITENRESRVKLIESEEKFSKAFYKHPIAMQIIDMDNGKRLEMNESFYELYGYSKEELKSDSVYELNMAVDHKASKKGIKKLLKDRFVKNEAMEIRTKNGEIKSLITSAAMLEIEDSNIAIISSIDITEKRKMEGELKENEQKFKQLFDNMLDGIAIYEPTENGEDFRIIDINKSGEKLTKVSTKDIQGKLVTDVFPSVLEIGLFEIFKEVYKTGNPKQHPLTLYKDGRVETWVENYVFKLPSGQIVAIYEDTSQEHKAIEALKESEEKFHKIFMTSPDSIILTNMEDGEIIDANNATLEITGYRNEEFKGKKTTLINLWKSLEDRNNYVHLLRTEGKVKSLEVEFIKKSGEIRVGLLSGSIMRVGNKDYIIGILRDITEKSLFKKQLEESNKKLRELYHHLNEVREEERKKIAREVHDDLGQKLTALNLDISYIKSSIPDELNKLKKQFDPVLELINQSIITVQKISTELRPGILDDLGLVNAIQWQSNEISRRSKLQFNLNLYKNEIELSDEVKTALFRVYQETLTNIIRHSKAKNVFVNLGIRKTSIIFEITDDGKGISDTEINNPTSFGIIGMKERIASINGNFEIYRQKNSGTRINIEVPF